MTSYVSISDGSYSIANKVIFQSVSINIGKGDRICLLGKNGAGKTTLMKILHRDIELDKGELVFNPKINVGYLPQKFHLSGDSTIYDYLMKHINVSDENRESKRYLADIILDKLQLKGNSFLNKLSGGQLRRAALAGALISEPDILLLDEPTNHLDIGSIEWLENYLRSYNGALVIISHDRTFLKNITNKTFWLDRTKILINGKGFESFEQFQEDIYLQEEKSLQKTAKELERQESWLLYGVTARRKRNQNRLQYLLNLRAQLKTNRSLFVNNNKQIEIEVGSLKSQSKSVLEIEKMGFEFTDVEPSKRIIKPFSLRVLKKEIIGIVGNNGSGKTTFLKLIMGQILPTEGSINVGSNIKISYFDQNKNTLNLEQTPRQILCHEGSDVVNVSGVLKHVSAYLKSFMFDSNAANTPISNLSGGEQSRLLLAKILANPGDLLILDEPTNDLDIETLDMLEEMLSEFKGTVIMVSHDRDFLDRLATRTLVFDNSGLVSCVVGGYAEYQKLILGEQKLKPKKLDPEKDSKSQTKSARNISYNTKREFELLPGKISSISKEIIELEKALAVEELYFKNPSEFNRVANSLAYKKEELSNLENRWLEIAELFE